MSKSLVITLLILLIILLLIILIYFLYNPNKWNERLKILSSFDKYKHYYTFKPNRTKNIPIKSDGKIFVSIASYRDSECQFSLLNLVKTAKNPELLRIVICQQNDPDILKEECLPPETEAQIEFINLSFEEAKGPTWARYLIQQKWQGEQYFLQVDSHMRFVKNWDQLLKSMLIMLPHKKSVLSQYPASYTITTIQNKEWDQEERKKKEKWEVKNLRKGFYIEKWNTQEGFFRIQSDYVSPKEMKNIVKPMPAKAVGACFLFSSAQIIKDAPIDPYTPFLFFGEEMDLTLRLYTRGWYFYAPYKQITFTNFDRSYRPTFWSLKDETAVGQLSRIRLYHRLGYLNHEQKKSIPEELLIEQNEYNLGKDRTIQEYFEFVNQNKNFDLSKF